MLQKTLGTKFISSLPPVDRKRKQKARTKYECASRIINNSPRAGFSISFLHCSMCVEVAVKIITKLSSLYIPFSSRTIITILLRHKKIDVLRLTGQLRLITMNLLMFRIVDGAEQKTMEKERVKNNNLFVRQNVQKLYVFWSLNLLVTRPGVANRFIILSDSNSLIDYMHNEMFTCACTV